MPACEPPMRCALCGRRTTWSDNPHRPFCSERCRLADLDGWLSGRYVIPGDPDEAATSPSVTDAVEGSPMVQPGKKT